MKAIPELFTNIRFNSTSIELSIPDIKILSHQITLLREPHPMFLACKDIIASETQMTFSYDLSDCYQPFSAQAKEYTMTEKYLILLHIGKYFNHSQINSTCFHPDNIVTTDTFDVAFLLRILPDMPDMQRSPHDEFDEYKVLVLSVVQEKYSFEHLMESGLNILNKDPFCLSVIQARTAQELEAILVKEYTRIYRDTRQNRVAFHTRTFKQMTCGVAFLIAALISALGYFVYINITETSTYGRKLFVFESYYDRDPQSVITHASRMNDQDMDLRLKRVVADALISTNEPENLRQAFYLDNTRQVEIIEHLIALEQYNIIAGLTSDNHFAQLYQAYYAKDYARAITLAESNTDLRLNAQAQIIRAKSYAAMNDYITAEAILSDLGEPGALLSLYKEHREAVLHDESNIELRQKLLNELDEIIKLMEEIEKGESR